MFKSNGGFTLVELIVVVAILAILAGIVLPTYGSYTTKASEVAGNFESAAQSHVTAADAALNLIPSNNGGAGDNTQQNP